MSAIHKYKYHLSALAIILIATILISSVMFAAYEFHKFNVNLGSDGTNGDMIKFHDTVKYSFYHTEHPTKYDVPFRTVIADNTIMQVGKTCILTAFYGVNGSQAIGNTTCPIGHLSSFGGARYVGIMNHTLNTPIKVNSTDTVAKVKQGGTGFAVSTQGMIFTTGQGAPVRCAMTMNSYNNVTCTTPAITITNGTLSSAGTYIAGAGEINGTDSTKAFMFAEQAFSGVLLHNGDSIIIAWTTTD